MKKSVFAITAAVALCAVSLFATGCADNTGDYNVELAAYKGDSYDANGNVEYNNDLFRRNDKTNLGPDPFILDDRENTGYFWGYSTNGFNFVYRSPDLTHWEPSGTTLDIFKNQEHANAIYKDVYAPEVIFDPDMGDEGKYVMYFSASSVEGGATYTMYSAVSDHPAGPFALVDFTDATSCMGEGNVHDYDKTTYDDYFAKYLFFDPSLISAVFTAGEGYVPFGKYYPTIDPHPFVDPVSDKKFLYFTTNSGSGPNVLATVEMENWLKPKWNTYKDLLRYGYYTVQDFKDKSDNVVSYEKDRVNEGAFVYYNQSNQTYYLAYSTSGYGDSSYCVAQAVSDKPDGPFRKLTADENAVFLSGGLQGSEEVSGTGHHCFITLGDKLYIVYHRHNDFYAGGGARNSVIDEVKFITATDPDGKNIQVLYTNGPTTTVQPQIEEFTDYTDIAGKARVSGGTLESGSSLDWINDGLLSSYQTSNLAIDRNVGETYITATSTITLDFDELQEIRAVMVYNSKNGKTSFRNVKRVEILSEDGKINYCILDIPFPEKYMTIRPLDDTVTYISPCSAAFAEFEAIKTKRVRVTVEVPSGQGKVGISEIKILGKTA